MIENALPIYVIDALMGMDEEFPCNNSSSKSIINKPISLILLIMLINKSLALRIIVLTFTLLSIFLFSSINALGNTYVGFYTVINWPVISISLINGTYTNNGIVIVIAPGTPGRGYTVFTGVGLIGGNYLLINGVMYANGTIAIAESIPINASINLSTVNNKAITQLGINVTTYPSDYEVIGQRTYHIGQLEREYSINTVINSSALVAHGKQLGGVVSNSGKVSNTSKETQGNYVITYAVIDSSLIATTALITLLIISPLLKYQVFDDRECIDDLFTKLVRRLGVEDPSLTHRDIRNYLTRSFRVNNDYVDRLINYYEVAIYGNRPIKCEEFKKVIREILNAGARGRD